jgi:hypothetical protein
MIHTRALTKLPILLVTIVIRLRDTNILIYLALAVPTRRGPRRGRRTRHSARTIASLKRLHLTTGDAIKGIQGRLPPK